MFCEYNNYVEGMDDTIFSSEEAARRIQRAWRHHSDRALFQQLKNLINFRNKGDPASLLKVINPLEAQLLDPAVGAHVRFRLGGTEWPPQIYYKIYLHSPVCDVNSFAPRNYTDKTSTSIPPLSPEQLPEVAEELGWYTRTENNGWRPISSLSPSAIDAITQMTDKPRRQKIKRRKRIAKKEIAMIRVKRLMESRPDSIKIAENLEDDDLFRWAESLDDDEDNEADWMTLGTTGPSSRIWWDTESDDSDVPSSDYDTSSELDEEELMKLIS